MHRPPQSKTQLSSGSRSEGTPSTSSQSPKRHSWADLSEDFVQSDDNLDFSIPPSPASGAAVQNPFPTLVDHSDLQCMNQGERSQMYSKAWRAIDATTPKEDEQQWFGKVSSSSSTAQVAKDDLLISTGSQLHDKGSCRPCIFFMKQVGCLNGKSCEFCHLRHPPRVRHRRHRKKASKERETGATADSDGDNDEDIAMSWDCSTPSGQDSRSDCYQSCLQAAAVLSSNSSSKELGRMSSNSSGATDVDQKISETLTSLFCGLFRAAISREGKTKEPGKAISNSTSSMTSQVPVVSWRAVKVETPSDDERLWLEATTASS